MLLCFRIFSKLGDSWLQSDWSLGIAGGTRQCHHLQLIKVKTITNKHGYHLKVAIAFIVALSVDLIWISMKDFCRKAWTQLIWLSKRNMLDAVDLPGNP